MRSPPAFWTTAAAVVQCFTRFTSAGIISHRSPGTEPHALEHVARQGSQPFRPPGSNIDGFTCDYTTNMGPQWVSCTSTPGCWLKNTQTGETYDVWSTDYEQKWPTGITRNYTLVVTDRNQMNQDGILFTEGKKFNGIFPGPLLEACWGDTLNITVINKATYNGTSIHWHGIRQLKTNPMDGTNGITQCPIPPGDSFNYVWKATQYGSSWYHSHYTVQYADGLQAPITLHGPATLPYDKAIEPLITSDWLHRSAFEITYTAMLAPAYGTILMNGRGNCTKFLSPATAAKAGCNPAAIPKPYTITFDNASSAVVPGKKKQYLLRIINTSFSSSLLFSIDNHLMTVVEADFVPVNASKPQQTINVVIGQRYHVIVEANPSGPNIPSDGNFWIRVGASGCFDDIGNPVNGGEYKDGYNRTAILRYNPNSTAEPTSTPWPNTYPQCYDLLTPQLKPTIPWTVKGPSNGVQGTGEQFVITGSPNGVQPYELGRAALNPPNTPYTPMQTTWGDPTFLNFDNFGSSSNPNSKSQWPAGWVVIPENFTSSDFVYLIFPGSGHPMHLHGHDFAIVEYSLNGTFSPSVLKPPYNNPMRRDVVLLPDVGSGNGYAVIAFKTDNPGAWLLHCHIALHASWGMSLQIMERQSDANKAWPHGGSSPQIQNVYNKCANWNTWAYNCSLHWPGLVNGHYPACESGVALQDDSGI